MDKPSSIAPGRATDSAADSTRPARIDSRPEISGLSEAEIKRRRLLVLNAQLRAGTLPPEAQARIVAEAAAAQREWLLEAGARAEARERAEREKLRPKHAREYRATNEFDPGVPPPSHARESVRSQPQRTAEKSESTERRVAPDSAPPSGRKRRRLHRPWKAPRRKARSDLSETVLRFGSDRAWSTERKHRLAIRSKRNDAVIAHPQSAAAALAKLGEWSRAAVLRCLRGEGWTLADEAGRRHVAWWCAMEDFAVARAWRRPRRHDVAAGATRAFSGGLPKFGMCVVGWTQSAIAITLSGAAYSCGGADPVDDKTVQRHTELASRYGGVHVVVRNPDADDSLRGRPTPDNPRGWPINQYWLPAPHFAPKPGFAASTTIVSFGVDGTPMDLAEALAIELTPRRKWRFVSQPQPPPQ